MIKQLKIGKKLLLLVTSLLVCLVVVGSVSLLLMHRINYVSTTISEDLLPSVIVSEEMNTMVSDHRIYELGHMLSKDSGKMQEYDDKIIAKRKEIENKFSEYALLVEESDGKLMEDAKTKWSQYIVFSDKVLELSRKNQTEAAMQLILGESRTLFDDVSNTCLKVVDYNKESVKQQSDKGDSLFIFSLVLTIWLVLSYWLSTLLE